MNTTPPQTAQEFLSLLHRRRRDMKTRAARVVDNTDSPLYGEILRSLASSKRVSCGLSPRPREAQDFVL